MIFHVSPDMSKHSSIVSAVLALRGNVSPVCHLCYFTPYLHIHFIDFFCHRSTIKKKKWGVWVGDRIYWLAQPVCLGQRLMPRRKFNLSKHQHHNWETSLASLLGHPVQYTVRDHTLVHAGWEHYIRWFACVVPLLCIPRAPHQCCREFSHLPSLGTQCPSNAGWISEVSAVVLLFLGGLCKTAGGRFAEALSAVNFSWSCTGLCFEHKTQVLFKS